jgi:hypothetical protein
MYTKKHQGDADRPPGPACPLAAARPADPAPQVS